MKLTGEDIAALVLSGVLVLTIGGAMLFVALRFNGLDWKQPFIKKSN